MSLYYCLCCGEIYKEPPRRFSDEYGEYACPKASCYGSVIEVDELILPVIAELNRKGYYTEYCCSGHYYERNIASYIMFEEGIALPSLPDGWKLDTDTFKNRGRYCIRFIDRFEKMNADEDQWFLEDYMAINFVTINSAMNNLLAWAIKLPVLLDDDFELTDVDDFVEEEYSDGDASDYQGWTDAELEALENVEDRSRKCIAKKK